MASKKKKEIVVLLLLIVAIIIATVGFALYTQTLNINGTVTVKGSPWNVHFEVDNIVKSANSVDADSQSVTKTDFTFTVTLNKPGDFYEATVDVINAGTLNAELTSVTMTALGNPQQKYLSYKVYYDGHEFTSSQTGLSYPLPATSGNTKTVKVRAEYIAPENSNDLPGTDDPVTLTASLGFEQAAS